MAELKRSFLGAKMNSDADPRLVPPGEYLHAENVHVMPTEGGTSGTVHFMKGTTKKMDLPDGIEVGIYAHDPTDTIYIFSYSATANRIMAYYPNTGVSEPILIDTAGVLPWSADTRITGIQMIEDTLGWTTPEGEPCTIIPQEIKLGSVDVNTHTQFEGRDFILSDITMIRKSPATAPEVTTFNSARDGVVTGIDGRNYTVAQLNDNSISATLPVDTPIILTFASGDTGFTIGDRLLLTTDAPTTDDDYDEYQITLSVTEILGGGTDVHTKIVGAPSEIQDAVLTWEIELIEGNPLYELKFARFAARWQYKNDQYSTISPFTQAVFVPGKFEYNPKKGYNLGMTNNVRRILLSNLAGTVDFPMPPDVAKIDILYKDSGSTTVYVVDTIESDEDSFEITNELISKIVQSNQLLRPSDNVPKSALALDAVGNRFVLGNYTQGYNTNELVEFAVATVNSLPVDVVTLPVKSLKSNRTLQAGITFLDEFGRETPIFTDKTGVIEVTKEQASTANSASFQMTGTPPVWADSFKYFIKDSENEYYNLAADRYYKSEEDGSAWISFPSSERNKLTDESYLISKKFHDSDLPVLDPIKYKVIDIENEAPDEIKLEYQKTFGATVIFDASFGSGVAQITRKPGSTPTTGSKTFLIASDQNVADRGVTSPLRKELTVGGEGKYLRFVNGTSKTNYYKIASVVSNQGDEYWATSGSTNQYLEITVSESFGDDTNFLYDGFDQNALLVLSSTAVEIYTREKKSNQEQFLGRFFVKLSADNSLESIFLREAAYVVTNQTVAFPGGYDDFNLFQNDSVNFKVKAGGAFPKLGYTVDNSLGGLDVNRNPSWANDDANDTIYDIVLEKRKLNPIPTTFLDKISQAGTKIRFQGAVGGHDQIYTIERCDTQNVSPSGPNFKRYWMVLDPPLKQTVNPVLTGEELTIEVVELEQEDAFTSSNPAVFETEPTEAIDLDLYYEASDRIPIADFNVLQDLDYYNCFAFGNGVESNRIRDDFNAPTIDKGPKVSTILDDPYAEEQLPNGLIWSGIYNSTSGVNNLNQFIQAETISKLVSPIYGPIQKLHARDTDLIALCEDKILKILADKDALYNANGSVNITASNAVLGQVVPFVGEYGISTDPNTFASYGYRMYFADRKRGEILRLSQDGLTPINSNISASIETILAGSTKLSGSFDADSGYYVLSYDDNSLLFSEASKGWTSYWNESPTFGISINNVWYTMNDGDLWAHDDVINRNNFYGTTKEGNVQVIFNDSPSSVKKFLAASYEGNDGWDTVDFYTNLQNGNVLPFVEKEGKFYNYVIGDALDWSDISQQGNIDTSQFNIQGIGQVANITGDVTPSVYTLDVFDDPSDN